jgi:DNA recombination protein RmuC
MDSPALAIVALAALLAAVAGFVAGALARRAPAGAAELQRGLDQLTRGLEETRREVQQGREAALLGLAGATQDLQGRIAVAQRALAEVKAIEHARTGQLDRAADSLRRLELIVAGSSTRGRAGENVLARALGQLPPDLLEANAAFGGRVVEYALRLPGGRLLPIDSKWTSVAELEQLEAADEPGERRRLGEAVAREVRARARELGKYLDPERTHALAVLAVPDAVLAAAPHVQSDGWRDGVLVVPYSLALPFVLSLYRLAVRYGEAPDAEDLPGRLAQLDESLRRVDEEVEGRLSRALVQAANARDALRAEVAQARRAVLRPGTAAPPAAVDPAGRAR